jgi:glutamine amidotransferase
MAEAKQIKVAIVDYGLGNLFSVKHACDYVGMSGFVTSAKSDILAADAVILPGVGAFGDAMQNLKRLDLINPVQEIAASGKPLIGVCLGLQLFMTESYEFGQHKGLGLIEGPVVRFDNPIDSSRKLKVPQIGWNRICRPGQPGQETANEDGWADTPLMGLPDGEFMYFVHSFYVKPEDPGVVLSISRYGPTEFCSSLRHRNIFATQFHPERSGPQGLQVYQNMITFIREHHRLKENSHA